jgi:hypothetical protein
MTLPLYESAAKAHAAWQQAEAAYAWSSTDFHEHARARRYTSDWVPAGAYDLAKKAQVAYTLKLDAKRKAALFEKIAKAPFCPPQRQAS